MYLRPKQLYEMIFNEFGASDEVGITARGRLISSSALTDSRNIRCEIYRINRYLGMTIISDRRYGRDWSQSSRDEESQQDTDFEVGFKSHGPFSTTAEQAGDDRCVDGMLLTYEEKVVNKGRLLNIMA